MGVVLSAIKSLFPRGRLTLKGQGQHIQGGIADAVDDLKSVASGRFISTPVERNLALSLPLDDMPALPDNGPVLDTSPNAKTLSLQPGAVRVDGPIGYAIDTTYGGAYTADESGLPMGNSARTIAVWFRTTDTASATRVLLSYGGSGTNVYLAMQHSTTGTFRMGNATSIIEFSDSGFVDGNWHLIVFCFDGTNASLYCDGVLKAVSSSFSVNTQPLNGLRIGAFTTGTLLFTGHLARPQIWSRALSAAEVLSLYNDPLYKTTNGIVITMTRVGMLQEAWPGTAVDTLPQWHDTMGVAYDPTARSVAEQQTMLEAMETAVGGMTLAKLQEQLDKEFGGRVVVSEAYIIGVVGQALCGLARCGLGSSTLYALGYNVTGTVYSAIEAARVAAIIQRYAPAHLKPNSLLTDLSATAVGLVGLGRVGIARVGRAS